MSENKYKAVKRNGKKYDEHRLIMEEYLGRKLRPDEVVHHKDGNKQNNRQDNLEQMSLSDHSRHHMTGKKLSKETRKKLSEAHTGVLRPDLRKLTDEQVRYIRQNYKPRDVEFGARALGRKFDVNHKIIIKIASGETYTDVK